MLNILGLTSILSIVIIFGYLYRVFSDGYILDMGKVKLVIIGSETKLLNLEVLLVIDVYNIQKLKTLIYLRVILLMSYF